MVDPLSACPPANDPAPAAVIVEFPAKTDSAEPITTAPLPLAVMPHVAPTELTYPSAVVPLADAVRDEAPDTACCAAPSATEPRPLDTTELVPVR